MDRIRTLVATVAVALAAVGPAQAASDETPFPDFLTAAARCFALPPDDPRSYAAALSACADELSAMVPMTCYDDLWAMSWVSLEWSSRGILESELDSDGFGEGRQILSDMHLEAIATAGAECGVTAPGAA